MQNELERDVNANKKPQGIGAVLEKVRQFFFNGRLNADESSPSKSVMRSTNFRVISQLAKGTEFEQLFPKLSINEYGIQGEENIEGLRLDDLLFVKETPQLLVLEVLTKTFIFMLSFVDRYGVLVADRRKDNIFLHFVEENGTLHFCSPKMPSSPRHIDFDVVYDLLDSRKMYGLSEATKNRSPGNYLGRLSTDAVKVLGDALRIAEGEQLSGHSFLYGTKERDYEKQLKNILMSSDQMTGAGFRVLLSDLRKLLKKIESEKITFNLSKEQYKNIVALRDYADKYI